MSKFQPRVLGSHARRTDLKANLARKLTLCLTVVMATAVMNLASASSVSTYASDAQASQVRDLSTLGSAESTAIADDQGNFDLSAATTSSTPAGAVAPFPGTIAGFYTPQYQFKYTAGANQAYARSFMYSYMPVIPGADGTWTITATVGDLLVALDYDHSNIANPADVRPSRGDAQAKIRVNVTFEPAWNCPGCGSNKFLRISKDLHHWDTSAVIRGQIPHTAANRGSLLVEVTMEGFSESVGNAYGTLRLKGKLTGIEVTDG